MPYYNPPRIANKNFGGKDWKLSRSRIEGYMKCQRCFYFNNRYGVAPPYGFPLTLNNAVDTLFKTESDWYRNGGQLRIGSLGKILAKLKCEPVRHKLMNQWRDPFTGVEYKHPETGMLVHGGIDDLWVTTTPQGKKVCHVIDYKSTAAETGKPAPKVYEAYQRQMDVYHWLLVNNGVSMSPITYFVYAIGNASAAMFPDSMRFDMKVKAYRVNTAWIEPTLVEILECLETPIKNMPPRSPNCDDCKYRQAITDLKVYATLKPVKEGNNE